MHINNTHNDSNTTNNNNTNNTNNNDNTAPTRGQATMSLQEQAWLPDRPAEEPPYFGRPILYTTTTQRGQCIEEFVPILVQLRSQTSLPGGGGV